MLRLESQKRSIPGAAREHPITCSPRAKLGRHWEKLSTSSILIAIIVESLGVSLVGTGLGLVLALLTSLVEFALGNSAAYGVAVRFQFIPSPAILASCTLVGILLGVLGGLFPALEASRIDPICALRA